jgi:hypothetical protein
MFLAGHQIERLLNSPILEGASGQLPSLTDRGDMNMEHDAGSLIRSPRTTLLLALPVLVILLSLMAWLTAVSRSGFWADDFLNVTHFARSLGDLSDDHINLGKYTINIFWAVGTLAFGAGSVIPFLLLNTLVFAIGVVLWLWAGTRTRWGSVEAWWIGGLFIATAAWMPTALWSSNITHSGGFLALGLGLLAHERSMRARTARGSIYWSIAGGAAWTLAIVSNLLYLGLLVIAAYCAFHQVLKIRRFGITTRRAGLAVGSWNLLIPVIFFVGVAYPATTSSPVYGTNGLQFFRQNLHFYRESLAPTTVLVAIYIAVLVLGIAGGVVAVRRRDWFPIGVLGAAGATAMPALIQAQQRDVHYMAMPLLLVFSALVAGARPVLLGQTKQLMRLRGALILAGMAALVLVFRQGADVRSFFEQSPYGHSLAAFRSEIASLTPEGSTICAKLDLDMQHQTFLIAAMSGEDGFLVPPISAAQAYLVSAGQTCPAQGLATHMTVSLNARGDFVAAG